MSWSLSQPNQVPISSAWGERKSAAGVATVAGVLRLSA